MATINVSLFLLILLMTILGAFAGLFLKKASSNLELEKLILNHNLYFGGILYLITAFMNIYLLKYLDYSVVLPSTSVTYIWTMLISYLILKEKITGKKALGVFCIIFGAMMISYF